MRKFKEGDIVSVKERCSGCKPGKEYFLFKRPSTDELFAISELFFSRDKKDIYNGCSCQKNWIFICEKKKKVFSIVRFLEGINLQGNSND